MLVPFPDRNSESDLAEQRIEQADIDLAVARQRVIDNLTYPEHTTLENLFNINADYQKKLINDSINHAEFDWTVDIRSKGNTCLPAIVRRILREQLTIRHAINNPSFLQRVLLGRRNKLYGSVFEQLQSPEAYIEMARQFDLPTEAIEDPVLGFIRENVDDPATQEDLVRGHLLNQFMLGEVYSEVMAKAA